jgi:hypothetical protein
MFPRLQINNVVNSSIIDINLTAFNLDELNPYRLKGAGGVVVAWSAGGKLRTTPGKALVEG